MILRRFQGAIEAVRGTQLAATRKIYAKGIIDKQIPLLVPDEERGTFVAQYRSALGVVTAGLPITGGCTYEDLPWWSQLFLKGGVAGVVRGVTAYDYLFIPTLGVDDLKSAAIEFGDETQAYSMPYAMADTFELLGVTGGFWTFNGKLVGKDMALFPFTAALPERAVEDVNMYLTKCAIGPAGAVPAAYMTGRFIGFKLMVDNQLAPKVFADGVVPTLGGMGRGRRKITLEVTLEGNAATITERSAWEAGTNRVVRITASGNPIAGSTGPIPKAVDLIVPGKWASFTMGDRLTNTIFTAVLQAEYDPVLAYELSLLVTNGVAVLP